MGKADTLMASNQMVIGIYVKHHKTCVNWPCFFVSPESDAKPIPNYATREKAIEAGWKPYINDEWVCPECAQP